MKFFDNAIMLVTIGSAMMLAGCQTSAGRGAAMGAATGGSVVGGAVAGAAAGAVTDGPAESALGGGARGAAMGAVTGGSALTGAIIGGTAGAIRSAKPGEEPDACFDVKTNEQVACPQ